MPQREGIVHRDNGNGSYVIGPKFGLEKGEVVKLPTKGVAVKVVGYDTWLGVGSMRLMNGLRVIEENGRKPFITDGFYLAATREWLEERGME